MGKQKHAVTYTFFETTNPQENWGALYYETQLKDLDFASVARMASTTTTLASPAASEPSLSRSPSIANNEARVSEKEEEKSADDEVPQVDESSDELDKTEYPKGVRLLAVVLALVLSIFLVALDMVRANPPGGPAHGDRGVTNNAAL